MDDPPFRAKRTNLLSNSTMPKLNPQWQSSIEAAFGLSPSTWQPLCKGSVNTLFVLEAVGEDHPLVMRFSHAKSLESLSHEAKLVLLLQDQGFKAVPEFRLTADKEPGLLLDGDFVVSCYKFIEGSVNQPLTDAQFESLLDSVPNFFRAMSRIDVNEFPGHRHFPPPVAALGRARKLWHRVELPEEIIPYLIDSTWPRSFTWADTSVIHGDLHAQNFIWHENGRLSAIIDFDRFWIGDPVMDICTLITGTTFNNGDLDERRFSLLLPTIIGELDSRRWSPSTFVDALIVMALYFFGRVNRHVLEPNSADTNVEFRDVKRAASIVRRREFLEQLLSEAFSFI